MQRIMVKKDMPGYMGVLSNHEWDLFERILVTHSKEFRQFYWLTKSLSEKIDRLSYIDDDKRFIVDIDFCKKINLKETIEMLEDELDNLEHVERYKIDITGNNNDGLRIVIEYIAKDAGLH